MPVSSVSLIFSLKKMTEIKIEKINSICPTALTSAAVVRPNATNQPNVAPVPDKPAGKLGFQYLITAKNWFLLLITRYKPTIIVWKTIAINEIKSDLSKRGASTDIMDILNVTTEAAKSNPDKRPTRVPTDKIELIRSLKVFKILSAFLA